ncbi:hypothetical protein GWI33_015948 [Rhynchophorus ferrugineus]|uniref:Uncharacterized protein n=1 Tax=Rhynchophorus ferrugineus TaxID=354439 RepID=A0A834MAT2_RHYFE|nr:hypothetical protein GWI33_015948 [Rhynchophorus ferrugineus]
MRSELNIKYSKVVLPPVRIELTTPGLQDQCSATELKRLRRQIRRDLKMLWATNASRILLEKFFKPNEKA